MMDRSHGGTLKSERAHIRQCIDVILATPVGARVMRRDFGSRVPQMVDQPANPAGVLRLIAASVDAVERWEPRVRVEKGAVTPAFDGSHTLSLACRLKSTGDALLVDTRLGAVG